MTLAANLLCPHCGLEACKRIDDYSDPSLLQQASSAVAIDDLVYGIEICYYLSIS